jgi:hypothetical protein
MSGPPFLLPLMRGRPVKNFIKEWAYACGNGAREKNSAYGFQRVGKQRYALIWKCDACPIALLHPHASRRLIR